MHDAQQLAKFTGCDLDHIPQIVARCLRTGELPVCGHSKRLSWEGNPMLKELVEGFIATLNADKMHSAFCLALTDELRAHLRGKNSLLNYDGRHKDIALRLATILQDSCQEGAQCSIGMQALIEHLQSKDPKIYYGGEFNARSIELFERAAHDPLREEA